MNRELLENVFVTALEGGSNYWYYINDVNHKKVRDAVPQSSDPFFATAMLTAILDHGVEVEIHDAENEDEVLGIINADLMKQRMDKLRNDAGYGWALDTEEDESGDATSSDIIFQFIVIGEVWFG